MSTPRIAYHPITPWRRAACLASPEMDRALAGFSWFFNFSRDAIYWALRGSGLPAGTTIWMPSFHCGLESQAAIAAGLVPRFYGIGRDLALDLDGLRRRLADDPGPVLIIHYFGFGQPALAAVAALCRERRVPLLEDCSHALFSSQEGEPLGEIGALATFSLYKTLGTWDGGALRVDEGRLAEEAGCRFSPPRLTSRRIWPREEHAAALRRGLAGPAWLQALRGRRQSLADREKAFEDRVESSRRRIFSTGRDYGQEISRLSWRQLRSLDPRDIVRRRRENWGHLDELLRGRPGYRPVYDRLPEGVCPLHFPVRTGRRSEILTRLQAAGVEPFIFGMFHHPAMAPADFPESRSLREDILCLPIHQRLGPREIERLAAVSAPLLAAFP